MKSAKAKGPKPKKGAKKANNKSESTVRAPATVVRVPEQGKKLVLAPVAVGMARSGSYMNERKGRRPGSIRITGREFFGRVVWKSTSLTGDALFNAPLNPSSMHGTRLQHLVSTYEKYRFNRFKLAVRPNAPSTTSGGYGISYDHDPSDATPPNGDEGVKIYMGMRGTREFSAWVAGEAEFALDEPVTDFYTNTQATSDERLIDQGQVYVWVLAPHALGSDISMLLEIEYDLELYIPALEPVSAAAEFSMTSESGTGVNVSGYSANKLQNALGLLNEANKWVGAVTTMRGNVKKFAPAQDATGATYINIPAGIYTLTNTIAYLANAIGNASSPVAHQFTPNNPIQSAYSETVFTTPSTKATGSTDQLLSTNQVVLNSPSDGCKWYMKPLADGGTFASGATLGKIWNTISPGGGGLVPHILLAGRPGKFGAPARALVNERIRLAEEKRQREREEEERAAEEERLERRGTPLQSRTLKAVF